MNDTDRQGIGMTSLRARQRLVTRLQNQGIENSDVLNAILETPRHLFVEEALASHAYEDTALPIGLGQTISQPYIVARITEALLDNYYPHSVLEIGTGCGYQAAILAQLVNQVYSIERIETLYNRTYQHLRQLGYGNIRMRHDDGAGGWREFAPFDGIVVTAAADEVPATLLQQLTTGGRLIIPVGNRQQQTLWKIERSSRGWKHTDLGAVSFVPLLGGIT